MITSESQWIEAYRKDRDQVWIMVSFLYQESAKRIYFSYNDYQVWKDLVIQGDVKVQEIQIRFRSNSVSIDTSSWKAVYLIRSAMGSIGGKTRDYLTVGQITGNNVEKTMWLVPELIVQDVYQDTLDSCFLEAVIFNDKEENK